MCDEKGYGMNKLPLLFVFWKFETGALMEGREEEEEGNFLGLRAPEK